jgi:hypothetical protein
MAGARNYNVNLNSAMQRLKLGEEFFTKME